MLTARDHIIIDGQQWTVSDVDGHKAVAELDTRRIRFDARDAVAIAPGLYGLAGRVEAPRTHPDAIVPVPAVALMGAA